MNRPAPRTLVLALASLSFALVHAPASARQGPPDGRQGAPRILRGPGGGPPPAMAFSFGGPQGGRMMQSLPVNEARLSNYADLLQLDDAQREAATALLEGSRADFDAARARFREQADALRKSAEENGDPSPLMQRMPELMREQTAATTKIQDTFFADMRSLLTPEQEQRWPAVERASRRDITLPRGRLSYESVDLISLTRDLKLDPALGAALAEPLAQYELQLDRALAERNKIVDEAEAMLRGNPIADQEVMQSDEFRKLRDRAREARTKLRDVNRTAARQLAALLPAANQADFESALEKQAFPRVFGESEPSRTVDSALALEDLTPEQEKAINDLKTSWEARARSANTKWAQALVKLEDSPEGYEAALSPFGPRDPDSPVAQARAERRAADREFMDSLRSVLTDSQRERLPSRRDRIRQLVQGGGTPTEADLEALADVSDIPLPPPGAPGGPIAIIRSVTIGPDGKPVEDTQVHQLAPEDAPPGGWQEGGEVEIVVAPSDATPPQQPAPAPAPKP